MGWWEVDREGREGEGGEPRSLDVPELALLEVVIDPLVPPRDDTRRRIRVPGGEVLAVWPALRDRTSALSLSLSPFPFFPPLFSPTPPFPPLSSSFSTWHFKAIRPISKGNNTRRGKKQRKPVQPYRMLELAPLAPLARPVRERVVPREARRVVLFAIRVGHVEDGGAEERVRGVVFCGGGVGVVGVGSTGEGGEVEGGCCCCAGEEGEEKGEKEESG